MSANITSYKDLIEAKKVLKQDISKVEYSIKENKILKLSSSILGGKSLKTPILETLGELNLTNILASPLGNLASTFLLSNKYVRKYFVAFTIIKETVPYAYSKLKDMLEEIEIPASKKKE